GRIYCFYNHNTDDIKREDLMGKRCDMGGHFVFKYSDDNGISWSLERFEIPVRDFHVDLQNQIIVNGKPYRFFWNVGKPFFYGDDFFLPLIKFDFHLDEIINHSEGVLLKSPNLKFETSSDKIEWETLPDGVFGLTAPKGGGRISEEHSYVPLSDGSFFCVYRTTDGNPAFSYSRDGGHTWDEPRYLPFKNPRAANFIWKCKNGRYLYWFHNNGLKDYTDRNPVWISVGDEINGNNGLVLKWSEPEILLYDDCELTLISYPDMIEDDGRMFITETQKDVARVHEIPEFFLDNLMGLESDTDNTLSNLIFEAVPGTAFLPQLPHFSMKDSKSTHFAKIDLRAGMTFEILCSGNGVLFDNLDETGKGILIKAIDGIVSISICDGRTKNSWTSSPYRLNEYSKNHIGIVIDSGPKVIYFILNGIFCDGGNEKPFGWCRFASQMIDLNGMTNIIVDDCVSMIRIYDKALMTCQMVRKYNKLSKTFLID
ncbi:MAG: exo-alpha-sialidase, partial [Clostridia bacterium]|nr:exo-alpha-sialidase [Clostridia bacterium]